MDEKEAYGVASKVMRLFKVIYWEDANKCR